MNSSSATLTYLAASMLMLGTSAAFAGQNGPGIDPTGEVTPAETEDLVFMREEEKLARDVYLVLGAEWDYAIFANIAKSEQSHMDALEAVLDAFGIADPVIDESNVGTFVDSHLQVLFDDLVVSGLQSDLAGLQVGALIEETDILDLEVALERSENKDVIATYENLLCGSRNHLRAFVSQVELTGEIYSPALLDQETLDAIADSPMERGCGTKRKSPVAGKGNTGKGNTGKGGGR